jgi:protein O-GlcNAc transferase
VADVVRQSGSAILNDELGAVAMPELDIDRTFQTAVGCHGSGQLGQAETLYRQILAEQPKHFGALHFLGVMAHQQGRHEVGVDLIRQALVIQPDNADAYGNLGVALKANGQLDEAIAAYRQAIALRPNYPAAFYNLGIALGTKGQLDEAIAAYRQAIVLRPDYAEAHNNLGNALMDKGQAEEAVAACRAAIAVRANYPEAYNNLGNALRARGYLEEAVAAARQAIALKPDFAEAYNNLGHTLWILGQLDQAIAASRAAIDLKPNVPELYNNLGNALRGSGQLDEAIAAYGQAISRRPNFAEAYNSLGSALRAKGRLDEAIAAYRQAIALKPNFPEAQSSLLYVMHLHPAFDAKTIAQAHREWNRQHAEPLKESSRPHANDGDPARRMRIGYVSGDLRQHSVAYFLDNLLAHHDAASVEVFCYADVARPDAVTARLRRLSGQWRSIIGLTDDQAAQRVREDGIDILVDLAGHMANNRLLVFARKPAPIQVTYLGYPDTTGMTAMDYRLTDAYADPPGVTEALHSEKLVRLPGTFLCYRPSDSAPEVGPVPSLQTGRITFGSFNALAKVNGPLVAIWSRILRAVPNAQLILKTHGLGCAGTREDILQSLKANQIDLNRIVLVPRIAGEAQHLQLYNNIDIALDTFPYHGTTTTCEALWMGVPVITLAGNVHAGRVGVSILSNIGLPELIADSGDGYVRLATELASDPTRLSDLRSTLRQRMLRSPLMDAPRFARKVESAYRQMWRTWCSIT